MPWPIKSNFIYFLSFLLLCLGVGSDFAARANTLADYQALIKSKIKLDDQCDLLPLTGGYSGAKLFKIVSPECNLVVRQLGTSTSKADVQRLADLSLLAASSGVSPCVHCTDLHKKVIITDYVEAKPTNINDLSVSDLSRLAITLKQFHQAGLPCYQSDPLERLFGYLSSLDSSKLPSCFNHVSDFIEVFKSLRSKHGQEGFIHTDLHALNILRQAEKFWIIDLEDSGRGDIFFDIGQLIKNFLFTQEQADCFIRAYLQHPTDSQRNYVYLNVQIAHILYAGWGLFHGKSAIKSQEQLDDQLLVLENHNNDDYLRAVHAGDLVLTTPEDKLKYGLVNLLLFMKEWNTGKIAQALRHL